MAETLPAPAQLPPLDAAAEAEVAQLAARMRAANGPLMRLVNFAGGKAENALELLPDEAKEMLERAAATALEQAYGAAGRIGGVRAVPGIGRQGHRLAAAASGALGGAGGLATALVELPATVTLIFGAIRKVALAQGFDPDDPAVRLDALAVFGSGGPLDADDGVNTSFLSARLVLNGATVQSLIARIAPKLAATFAQKLGLQALPLLGAVSGAAVNYAFIRYFEEMAQVRFGLRRLALSHDPEAVERAFAEAARKPPARR